MVSGITEKSLQASIGHGRTLSPTLRLLFSALDSVGIRPRREIGDQGSSLSLAILN